MKHLSILLLFASVSLVQERELIGINTNGEAEVIHPDLVFHGKHEVVHSGGFVRARPCPARPPYKVRQDLHRPPV